MYKIITDTSANLPAPLAEKQEITVIPFSYLIDDVAQTCLDTEHFDGNRYYGEMKKGMKVTTSQVTPQLYQDVFRPFLEAGEDILFVGMSSGISGSFSSAQSATAELEEEFPDRKIRLIDTKAASLGEGIVVLHACDCRRKGMDIEETAEYLRMVSRRVCQIFTVEDLKFLWRTGRCSGVSAAVGTALKIMPLLMGNENGEIIVVQKKRGRKAAIKWLADQYAELVREPARQIVGIAHAGCAEDAAYLKKLLIERRPPRHIMTVDYEPVTGAHVGPGALALFFESDENVRSIQF